MKHGPLHGKWGENGEFPPSLEGGLIEAALPALVLVAAGTRFRPRLRAASLKLGAPGAPGDTVSALA